MVAWKSDSRFLAMGEGGTFGRMDERQLVEAGEEARGDREAAEERTQRDLDGGTCPPGCSACD